MLNVEVEVAVLPEIRATEAGLEGVGVYKTELTPEYNSRG